MKKKIIAVIGVVMIMLIMPLSANLQIVSAKETRAITYAKPSILADKHTGNIGDVINSTISGLSYDKMGTSDSSEHYSNITYSVYGQSGYYNNEFINRMLAFEGLEIGGATAKDASDNFIDVNIEVNVSFNVYPNTSKVTHNFTTVSQAAGETKGFSISKQEMENFALNQGYTLENIETIRVRYQNPMNIKMAAMSIDDSVYKTSIVNDMQVMKSTDTYARVNLQASAQGNNYEDPNTWTSNFKADFVRFNTLDMDITSNKDSFIPGDEITITWTLTNTSSYNNSVVYMGMEYEDTGLIDLSSPNDTSTITHTDWKKNPYNELYIGFFDNIANTWQILQSKGEYKVSKNFKIDDAFSGEEISFDNYTMVNMDYANRKIVPFTLKLKDYTIQFETNGGNKIDSTKVFHGRNIMQPENPVKKGYTFDGWYQDTELTTPWSFNNDVVNENKILYAKWKTNEKPIIHAENIIIEKGDFFDPLVNVWATDKEDGEIKLTEANVIANDVDTNIVGTYHVTYEVSDSHGNVTSKTITVTVKEKKANDIINYNDFVHYNKDGQLSIEDIFKKGNVNIKDKDGNNIKNSDLKYNQSELDILNNAIKKNEEGIYPIKFTTPSGNEFTVKITTKKYTSIIIVETDKDENTGNGMDKSNQNNKVNTNDTSNTTNLLAALGISGLILCIIFIKKKEQNTINKR